MEFPYVVFGMIKKIWSATGLELPSWLRHLRHSLLGNMWPAHADASSAQGDNTPSPVFPHKNGCNILVIDDVVPMPDKDSGSLRRTAFLDILCEEGNNVTFIPSNLWRTSGYTNALEKRGIRVLGLPDMRFVTEHLYEEGESYDIVIVGRVQNMTAYAKDIRRYAPQAALIFDTVDLHFLRMERQATTMSDRKMMRAAMREKKRELHAVQHADCTIVVSEEEKTILTSLVPDATISVLSNIHDVRLPQTPFAQRENIMFVGAYGHQPNADAAQYLVREIWPLVRQKLPDATLHLIGEDPDDVLTELGGDGVIVTGHVPDLDAVLEQARVSVAPLRYGAGVKGKINMSMSRGVPIVTTSIGAEGMGLHHEENCLIADSAENFAAMIVRAYTDETLWQKLSHAGPALIQEKFSKHHARTAWKEISAMCAPPKVLAIIPTACNDPAMIYKCLDSLEMASVGVKLRVIFVLCPATEEKKHALLELTGNRAECVVLDEPFSFARSNNAGLKMMTDETHVLFLNDDCFFRKENDIRTLCASQRKNNLAAIGPWLHHHSHREELPRERRTSGLYGSSLPIVGACMIWDRKWLDVVGNFDETFDGYGMEEADLLFRALEKGGRWMRDDSVVVDHIHHATFGKTIKDEEPHLRNLARWEAKYPGISSWGHSPEWDRNLTA